MIKGSILIKKIAIINIYAHNNRVPKTKKLQHEAKTDRIEGREDNSAIIVEDFHTHFQ